MSTSKLTPRQWRLYNYLKTVNCLSTQREIALNLKSDYPCTDEDLNDFHNSAARAAMTDDIRAINKSDTIQKLIISTPRGVKLATEAEAQIFLRAKYADIFRRLERARKLERKIGLNGQFKFIFGQERGIVQAFTDSNAEGDYWRRRRKRARLTQKQAVDQLRNYSHINAAELSNIEKGYKRATAEQEAAFAKVYPECDNL